MRIKIDASPDELQEKGDALVRALVKSVLPVCPELAERLEKALPEPKLQLRDRALRDIHKITKDAYRKMLEAMRLDISRVLDEAAQNTSAGQEFEKAWGEERPGHKYKSRRRGPSGEWEYEYDEPHQAELFAPTPGVKRPLLQIVDNDPALTDAQKSRPPSEALKEIMAKPASDPAQWKLPAGARLDPWQPEPIAPDAEWSHPDYGEGKGVAPWQVGDDWRPDFHRYDYIIINSSAGKDSQAMLTHTVELAKQQGYPLDKIIVVHADLGRVEWEGTKALAQQQAEHYGLTFKVVQREKEDLLQQIEARHGDLQQKIADTAALAEAGIRTWKQLAALDDEAVTKIIGTGKGKSQWDGRNRAGKLLRGVGGVEYKLKKMRKAHEAALADAEQRVKRWAEKAAAAKSEKSRESAAAKSHAAQEALAKLKAKGNPEDWPIDYGQPIAWPSADSRYCTADHKRAEIDKLITKLADDLRAKGHKGAPRILNALGIRAQEGEGRAKMPNFERAKETSNQIVDDWFPLHRWPEEKVWSTIARSGVPYHKAYALGMRRLSCVFCVFATKEDLMVAATHNPHLFRTYLELEEKVGSSFKADQSLADVADEIKRRREEGYELNELAEWVKKALGLDDEDDALIKAELSAEDPNVVGMVLTAALARIEKHGRPVRSVAIDWKVKGVCVHLDCDADSHHVLWVTYPAAYNASIAAAAFAQRHELMLEENNAPAPMPAGEELAKALGAQRPGHKYIRREGVSGHYTYIYAEKAKPRYHKLSPWAVSHFETEVAELAEDPEGHGLDPEEAEDYKVLHEAVDYDKGRFRLPDHPKAAERMHSVLTDMINLHDEHAEKDKDPEQRKFARYQRDGLSALADKVIEPLRAEEERRQAPEQLELFQEAEEYGVDLGGYFPSGSNHEGEIRGFHELGWNVGVAVDALDKQGNAEEALTQLAGTKTKVFVDSGAFGEVEPNFPDPDKGGALPYPDHPIGLAPLHPISHEEWVERLSTYKRLAEALGPQLYAVAPDRVADQEVTKERLTRYLSEVKEIRAKGANILVPLQKGKLSLPEFDKWVADLFGDENYVRAIPMKKDATSTEDLRQLLAERKVARIHLLGLGEKSERYPEIMAMVKEVSPGTIVTMDSVAVTAAVGRDKKSGKPRKLTAAQDRTRGRLETEIFHEPESGLDYTDEIYRPSGWSSKALRQRGAQKMGLDVPQSKAFIADPDQWIREHGDHPLLDNVLDAMWKEYMLRTGSVAEQKRRAVHEAFGGKGRLPMRSYADVTQEARSAYHEAKASGDGDRIQRTRAHLMDTGYQHALDVYEALQTHEISPKQYNELHAQVFGPLDDFKPKDRSWQLKDPDLHPAEDIAKAMGGPFIGPRGGKWADPEHTIHWQEAVPHEQIVEQAHPAVKEHAAEGAMRAAAVGADAPSLKYVGAGGEGMIFEDGQGRAYKVSRFRSKARPDKLRNEAEAMMALADSPVAHLVPKVHGYDEQHDVITRDMIPGASAGWGQSSKLQEAYKKIAAELSKRGWYAPEFKEDSFIIPQGGGEPVMVDMGFVHPKGEVLAAQLKRRVEKLNPEDDWFDFQLDVSHAYQDGAIDVSTAKDYLERGIAGIKSATPDMVVHAKEGLGFTARTKGDLKAGQGWDDIPSKVAESKPKNTLRKLGDAARRARLLRDGYEGPIEADAPLAKVEDAIRGEKFEHAACYDAKGGMLFRATSGLEDACQIFPAQAKQIRENGNVTFTHNHPHSGSPSLEDITLAVLLNIKEMRAVCSNGVTFVLTRPEGGWVKGDPDINREWATTMRQALNLGNGRASARMDSRIMDAGGEPGSTSSKGYSEEVWDDFRHEETGKAVQEAARKLGWGFRIEGAKRGGAEAGGPTPERDQPGPKQLPKLPSEVGDKVPVTVHPLITGRDEETHPYRIVKVDGDQVQLSRHEGSDYGPTMPKASVKHFMNDLAGKVDLPPSGNTHIDLVTSGKAKFLGKGNDGLAFKAGGKVVKVSTTVPYQPENPGHRTPEEAAAMLKKQVDTANTLADAGVPGIQRSEFVQHGDKGFQIKSWVKIPEKFSREQLDAVQDSIIAMHKQGYALNDEPQAGLDKDGKVVLFDVGNADKNAGDPKDWNSNASQDFDRLKSLYAKHGQEFVRRDFSEGQRNWEHFISGVDRWMDPKKPNPGFARFHLKRAVDALSKEARATLKGPELEKRLAQIKSDAEDQVDLYGLGEEPAKPSEGAPKAEALRPTLALSPPPPEKPKKRTPVPAPAEEKPEPPLPGQLGMLGAPSVPPKKRVRKPVQQALFPEPEKQRPEDKPLRGQQQLFKAVLPDYTQRKGHTCGVAALRTVLSHFGAWKGEESELERMLHTTEKDGTEPEMITAVSKRMGLRAQLKTEMTVQDLERYAGTGALVIVGYQAWRESGKGAQPWSSSRDSGHYAVIRGVEDGNVKLKDPMLQGVTSIPVAEFVDRWHTVDGKQLGIVVTRGE